MHPDQYPWVELYENLMDADGPARPAVLVPWLDRNPGELRWLGTLAAADHRLPLTVPTQESWRLYAASRVNELLLLGFQEGDADGSSWPGPQLSVPEYLAFTRALGLREAGSSRFRPFFHEIVGVDQADDEDEPISVVTVHWPALMLGPVLFSRAGVTVRGGARHVRKDAAERSTLYWAHRRKNRPHVDLSHGWGHNSRWRTGFRWDLVLDGSLVYNAAEAGRPGATDLSTAIAAADPGHEGDPSGPRLTSGQRRELLTNRCFVTAPEPEPAGDHHPYRDHLRVPA